MILDKIKTDSIIVVEGRDDKFVVEKIVDAPIYVLNGFSGVSRNNLEKLVKLSKTKEIILILDPDFAGKKMREIIRKYIPKCREIFVPRKIAIKKDNIGIENVLIKDLYDILNKYFSNNISCNKNENFIKFTIDDLLKYDLTATNSSKKRREMLTDELNFGYCNSKQLLKNLNNYKIDRNRFEDIMNKIELKEKTAVIFGKFLPAHKGHINFIKEVSKKVNKLLVFLCVEENRDNNLLENSTLPKKITNEDRYNILNNELKNIKNIKIYILDESNINPYPNGWLEWTNRVFEKLENENEKIDIVFTNEIQDIPNYNKYFNLPAEYIDLDREKYNVSSTKIRNDYVKYRNFLTNFTIKLLEE